MNVLSNSDNSLCLYSHLDSSLCCYSCAGIFSTYSIPTPHTPAEVIVLASLHAMSESKAIRALCCYPSWRVEPRHMSFFLSQCVSRHGRPDFCKTAMLSVVGAFICCCDTTCINFSFQCLPCFLKEEKFQSSLNLISSNVIQSPGQCDLAVI